MQFQNMTPNSVISFMIMCFMVILFYVYFIFVAQVRPSVSFLISEPCICCHGTGRVEALETSFSKIEREILRMLVSESFHQIVITFKDFLFIISFQSIIFSFLFLNALYISIIHFISSQLKGISFHFFSYMFNRIAFLPRFKMHPHSVIL